MRVGVDSAVRARLAGLPEEVLRRLAGLALTQAVLAQSGADVSGPERPRISPAPKEDNHDE